MMETRTACGAVQTLSHRAEAIRTERQAARPAAARGPADRGDRRDAETTGVKRALGVFTDARLTKMEDDSATRIILGMEQSRLPVDPRDAGDRGTKGDGGVRRPDRERHQQRTRGRGEAHRGRRTPADDGTAPRGCTAPRRETNRNRGARRPRRPSRDRETRTLWRAHLSPPRIETIRRAGQRHSVRIEFWNGNIRLTGNRARAFGPTHDRGTGALGATPTGSRKASLKARRIGKTLRPEVRNILYQRRKAPADGLTQEHRARNLEARRHLINSQGVVAAHPELEQVVSRLPMRIWRHERIIKAHRRSVKTKTTGHSHIVSPARSHADRQRGQARPTSRKATNHHRNHRTAARPTCRQPEQTAESTTRERRHVRPASDEISRRPRPCPHQERPQRKPEGPREEEWDRSKRERHEAQNRHHQRTRTTRTQRHHHQ